MKLKHLLFIITATVLTSFSFVKKLNKYQIYTASYENVLGTSLDMKFSAVDEYSADRAEEQAIKEIKRLNSILSSYDSKSEFSKWANTINKEVEISEELKEILKNFEKWNVLTHGKLSASVGMADQLWKEAEKNQQLPSEAEINKVVQQMNQQQWQLHPTENFATHLGSSQLLLNTFVKSYIINKAVDKAMESGGVNGALINIGGDIIAKGTIQENVSILDPQQKSDNLFESTQILLKDHAIATSGNYKRGYTINGQHFSHIFDPQTGKPVDHIQSSTVIAKDAITAGALATAFNVLSVEDSKALAQDIKDVEYQIITKDNQVIESEGWKNLAVKSIPVSISIVPVHTKEKLWNTNYEATINIELARLEGFARRPFVAIWIVNSNNETVKNIALWFNKPRWLPDLKEWYHQNYQNYSTLPQGVFSISSATRPAGNYTFKWDGKDDKGELVKQGKYTVYIEAAREHGTYQIMKQELIANEKEQSYNIDGNTEIASAAVAYKKIQ